MSTLLRTALLTAAVLIPFAQAAAQPSPDQEIGKTFEIKPESLPQPNATPAVGNAPVILPFEGQTPTVPEGFTATPFATGLTNPRQLLVLPNGDVIVAEQKPGHLTLLRDANGDGKAEIVQRHAEGFKEPYGLAWRNDSILVADQTGVWRVPHRLTGARPFKPAPNQRTRVTAEGVFGIAVGHANRDLEISPRSNALFIGVGSAGNIGEEPEPKATIQRFRADGSGQQTFASGLRNPSGLAFQPRTNDLYAVVQERDGLGDGLAPDYLTRIQEGAFYGWPYAYSGQNPQPGFAEREPEKVKASLTPDLLFEAHSAPMDLVFYEGTQFPEEYRDDAFVALKGSWNRAEPTGYKVVRVPFENGRPTGGYQNFMTGFWVSGREKAEVWGRPADLAVARDGALFVLDDTGGTIWRVSYGRPRAARPTRRPR